MGRTKSYARLKKEADREQRQKQRRQRQKDRVQVLCHPDTSSEAIAQAAAAAETPADVYLDVRDVLAVSQCATHTWRGTGNLVAAIATRKGTCNVGLGNGDVFVLQEWDDRQFHNDRRP